MGLDSVSCPGRRHWSASSADRFWCGRVARSIGALGASEGPASSPIRYLRARARYAATPSDLSCSLHSARSVTMLVLTIGAGVVRNEDSLGPDPRRVRDRARSHLGRDTMDGLAARLPTPARYTMDRDRRHAGVPSTGVLSLVVLVRCLCTEDFCRGRDHRLI